MPWQHRRTMDTQYFLASSSLLQSQARKGLTPLWWAINNHHTAVVQMLLWTVDDSADHRPVLCSALHIAAWQGEEEIVRLLLEYQAISANHADSLGRTPLLWAARGGHSKIVSILLNRLPREPELAQMLSDSLEVAAFRGHEAVVHLQLENGAAKSVIERKNALLQAAFKGHHAVVRILLQVDNKEITAAPIRELVLNEAATVGHTSVVETIIGYEVNLEARSKGGETALYRASERGHAGIFQTLLERGADVEALASTGWHCLDGSGSEAALYYATGCHSEEVINLLLEHGAVIDSRCRDGETAFFRAVANGNPAFIQLLLDHGANQHMRNRYNNSPTQRAIEIVFKNKRREILNMLERASKCNTEDAGGVKSSNTSDELSARAIRFKNRSPSHDHKTTPQLLAKAQSSFHLERIEELLEMDEGVESSPDHNFSRFLFSKPFRRIRNESFQVRDALKVPVAFHPRKGIL